MGSDRVDEMLAAWRVELPDVATLPLELVKRVGLLAARIEESTQAALAEHDLTYAEFDVLATLRRAGAPYRLKPGELSRASMLTTGGTSNILQRLVAVGLVEREPDPTDGRSRWVRLTERGVDTTETLARATTVAHTELFADLSDDTARTLADLLRDTLRATDDRPARR